MNTMLRGCNGIVPMVIAAKNGNPSNVNRLLDITKKMKNTSEVHIVKLLNFRAISSGYDTFENIFNKDGFDKRMGVHNHLEKKIIFDCADFMCQLN